MCFETRSTGESVECRSGPHTAVSPVFCCTRRVKRRLGFAPRTNRDVPNTVALERARMRPYSRLNQIPTTPPSGWFLEHHILQGRRCLQIQAPAAVASMSAAARGGVSAGSAMARACGQHIGLAKQRKMLSQLAHHSGWSSRLQGVAHRARHRRNHHFDCEVIGRRLCIPRGLPAFHRWPCTHVGWFVL